MQIIDGCSVPISGLMANSISLKSQGWFLRTQLQSVGHSNKNRISPLLHSRVVNFFFGQKDFFITSITANEFVGLSDITFSTKQIGALLFIVLIDLTDPRSSTSSLYVPSSLYSRHRKGNLERAAIYENLQ